MKTRKMKLTSGLLVFVLAFAAFAMPVFAAEPRTISVMAMGSVNVEPDMASVTLGVETRGPDASLAQATNGETVAAVMAAMRAKGIADADMQTVGFSMWPMQVPHMRIFDPFFDGVMPPEEREYVVTNNLRITIRNIDIVGDVLSAAMDAGANVAGGVSFGLDDSTAAYNRALALAMQNAAGKANAVAGNLGVTLSTTPISVEETGGMFMPVMEQWMSMDMGGSRVMAAGATVPVVIGELSVRAVIQVTYSFE